jgi:hypothetical protein
MYRRQFVALAPAIALAPGLVLARNTPVVTFAAEDFAEVRYHSGEDDDGVRSITVRVSQWDDPELAETYRQEVIRNAGSNLPMGEFYQSEPVDLPVPEGELAPPATARGWYTTVGAAGYVTDWILLVTQRETLVWEVRVSGAEGTPLLDLATDLAFTLTSREPGDVLFALVPGEDDVPAGLVLEYTMSPGGTFDADGNPIPEPTPT